MSRLKRQSQVFSFLDLTYWPPDPLHAPVVLDLPTSGIRLRFDGLDQRLRLIEVRDFSKTSLKYDGKDIIKVTEASGEAPDAILTSGPSFRYVYDKLLGPSFPGQYIGPGNISGAEYGSYVLSYPGIAFSFDLHSSDWRSDVNFVTLLSSSSVGPASSMAIFSGASWQEACSELFSRPCPNPRSLALSGKGREHVPDEVELAFILPHKKVRLIRRSSAPYDIDLGTTTPQDLISELGPPDSIYTKSDRRLSIHRAVNEELNRGQLQAGFWRNRSEEAVDTDYASSHVTTDDSEEDAQRNTHAPAGGSQAVECFYNYCQHGFDILLSNTLAPPSNALNSPRLSPQREHPQQMVVTKILLHGNVPGSYPFNKYRRLRWIIDEAFATSHGSALDSETKFADIAVALQEQWPQTSVDETGAQTFQKGMPINRDWDSPGSSCELLGGWEEQSKLEHKGNAGRRDPGFGKTELFGYPGVVFEVLSNGAVSCLTIY